MLQSHRVMTLEQSQSVLSPEQSHSEITLEQSHSVITPEQSQSVLSPEQSHSEITLEQSHSEITLEQSHSVITPEQSQSVLSLEQSHSEITLEQSLSVMALEQSQSVLSPEQSHSVMMLGGRRSRKRQRGRPKKDEEEKIKAAERKEAALSQMRYLLSVCEQYSDVYSRNANQAKALKDKNTFVPTLADIEGIKKEVRSKKIIRDYDLSKHLKYFEGGKLHQYQMEGVSWMYMLYTNASNGILADEMGLGKTVQVIALICVLLEQTTTGPFLIVAPLSTIPNWQSEFQRFAPKIPVVALTGSAENRQMKIPLMHKKYKVGNTETHPVVVVSYQTPLLEFKELDRFKWRYIIVDEGHRIKNHESQLAIKLRSLRSENRLLLTGTPLQNNIVELWALLNFLLPTFFGNMSTFTELVLMEDLQDEDKMIEEEQSNNLVSKIHRVLQPFMLRRLKVDVLDRMVPKKEVTLYCPLSPLQMKLYELVIENNIAGLRGLPKDEIDLDGPRPKRKCAMNIRDYTYRHLDDYIEQKCLVSPKKASDDDTEIEGLIFTKSDIPTSNKELKKVNDMIIRLTMQNPMMMFRKIVNHPYLIHFPLDTTSTKLQLLINEELVTSSGKLLVLDTLLPELKKRRHKVLLFSQLTMGLDLIEEYMLLRGYNYRRLDGNHSIEERAISMREFNNDKAVFIFLLSTRAGGLGLNLTGADTVIFFDRDWNPQVDIQAQDRCHRLGQTRPVVIYTLTTKNTIDEHVINTGKMKRVLERVVISDGKFKTVTQDDKSKTEDMLLELRKALRKPEDDDCYIFSNDLQLNRLLDRSDLYEQMREIGLSPNTSVKYENKENRK